MCYRPINVQMADGSYQKVKCGKCLECLNEKRNSWVIRMTEELKDAHQKGVFFTLTYSDENIPKNYLVYEQSITDTPKLYESESDYNYATPVGVVARGRNGRKYSEAPDKVLQEFYRDYVIEDISVDNNYKRYEDEREDCIRDRQGLCTDEEGSTDPFDWHFGDSVFAFDPDARYDPDFRCFDTTDSGDDIDYCILKNDLDYGDDEDPFEESRCVEEDLRSFIQGAVDRRTGEIELLPESGDTGESEGDGQKIKPYLVLSFNSVRQKDLQDWLKRGRAKLTKQGKKFTYFITSEYGPRTLRPHYHGCFFGVSLDDVRFMFDDWKAHFGRRIKADNINGPGGVSYCAKYCAKGFYEHPLCSRDFFYMKKGKAAVMTGDEALDQLMGKLEFTEYHSKHYERCMEFFGIDAPIVQPSFKLVSKGLGLGYVSRMKVYFRVPEAEAAVEKISIAKIGEEYEREITEVFEDIEKYYHYTSSKGFTYTMPSYYSTKIFSDALRHAYQMYVRSQYDRIYLQQFRQLQTLNPGREDAEIISMLEKAQRDEKIHTLTRKLENTEKYFNRSKL